MASSAAVWRWPLVLAAATMLGLLSALLGEGGAWWALSWIALSTPLAVIAVCLVRARRGDVSRRSSGASSGGPGSPG
jgi:hypothetical protein